MHSPRNLIILACLAIFSCQPVQAQLTKEKVARSLQAGVRYLKTEQHNDGHWDNGGGQFPVGITSLTVMAMLNSQIPITDNAVQKGLGFLRSLPPAEWPRITGRSENYELSLMLMALAIADQETDRNRIFRLASMIENGQVASGANVGGWTYTLKPGQGGGADESNSQYSVLALREAAHYGVPIKRETWVNAKKYWQSKQSSDGGWGYQGSGTSSGSMTVAGIASTVICDTMLGVDVDQIDCCAEQEKNKSLELGLNGYPKILRSAIIRGVATICSIICTVWNERDV